MAEVLSSRSTSEDKHSAFPLLDLPPELWIRICKYAVIEDKVIQIAHPGDRKHVGMATQQPAITRVSKTIREEILPTFYQHNEFLIHDDLGEWKGLKEWRKEVGIKYRSWFDGLYVTSNSHECEVWLTQTFWMRTRFKWAGRYLPSRLVAGLRTYTFKMELLANKELF